MLISSIYLNLIYCCFNIKDVETVYYNGDINIDDISTAGDVEIENLSDAETIDYDKVNKDITQQHAKRIIKKYRSLKRKAAMNDKNKTKKEKTMMLSLLNKCLSILQVGYKKGQKN